MVLQDETIIADFVVLAVPNETVKKVLDDTQLEEQLQKFTTASAITMYVGFDVPDSVLPSDGTGFIVSHNSDLVCNASTWTSRKWKHTSANGNLLVRLFYKNINPRYEELAAMSDEELTKVALEDIRLSLGIEAKTCRHWWITLQHRSLTTSGNAVSHHTVKERDKTDS